MKEDEKTWRLKEEEAERIWKLRQEADRMWCLIVEAEQIWGLVRKAERIQQRLMEKA